MRQARMSVKLRGRSFLNLKDFSSEEIRFLLDISHRVKAEKKAGVVHRRFAGKTLALLFEKRSTRTRCAFETAFGEEGGHPVFLSTEDTQLGSRETIEDTARVLGGMFDAIAFRGYLQETVETLSRHAGVPVYNGLTAECHPTQALADIMTIEEEFPTLTGTQAVFVGDAKNNVATSFLIACAKTGVDCTMVGPEELLPDRLLMEQAIGFAEENDSTIRATSNRSEALRGADVVYTDVWVSMGEEEKAAEKCDLLRPYRVDEELMSMTGKSTTILMHCLPAVRGNEVTAGAIDSPASRVWEQAANRKHTAKALLLATLCDEQFFSAT